MTIKKKYISPVIEIEQCFDPLLDNTLEGSLGTGDTFSKGDMFDDGFEDDDFGGWDDIAMPRVIQ